MTIPLAVNQLLKQYRYFPTRSSARKCALSFADVLILLSCGHYLRSLYRYWLQYFLVTSFCARCSHRILLTQMHRFRIERINDQVRYNTRLFPVHVVISLFKSFTIMYLPIPIHPHLNHLI